MKEKYYNELRHSLIKIFSGFDLSIRETDILLWRIQGLPLQEIANRIDRSHQRTSSLESSALNKLSEISDHYKELLDTVISLKDERKTGKEKIGSLSIKYFFFSNRTQNCLKYEGIKTIKDLTSKNEWKLLRIKDMGKKSIAEIKKRLAKYNLSLRPDNHKFRK